MNFFTLIFIFLSITQILFMKKGNINIYNQGIILFNHKFYYILNLNKILK